MFNVLIDFLPTEYKGYKIDSDFRTGIQIFQALNDKYLSQQERVSTAFYLLFMDSDDEGNPKPYVDQLGYALPLPDARTAFEGLTWFLNDWNHDNNQDGIGKKVTDYDIDQWRIYSAFRAQYGINLNKADLHFWEFMGLLTTLDECAYTRVMDIRGKELSKCGKEEKKLYVKLKKTYALDAIEREYTSEQKKAIDDFDKMMEEQKKIKEQKKAAKEAFLKVTGRR